MCRMLSVIVVVVVIIFCFCSRGAAGSVLLIANGSSSTFQSLEAEFTPQVTGSGISGYMMFGNPSDACSTLEAVSDLPFLLTMRGNCSFDTKVRYAQDAGFAAVIIYNNESGSSLLTMSGSSDGISIYAVFVRKATGETLSEYVNVTSSEVWILPTYEDTVWSVMVFTLISLLAIGAGFVTWYTIRRHQNRPLRNGYSRYVEPCVMSSRIVQAMPSIIYKVGGNEKAVQESCTICLEDYIAGEKLRVLPCGHRFHSICIDAWLTMWRAVCPMCKRDARYEFPDMQISDRTPLVNTNIPQGYHGSPWHLYPDSTPILIPKDSSYPSHSVGPMDSNSSRMGRMVPNSSSLEHMVPNSSSSRHMVPSSSSSRHMVPSSSNAGGRITKMDDSLLAFRASPYFTPPSSSQNFSHLLPSSYPTPCVNCSPGIGFPSPCSCSSRDPRSKSYLNLFKAGTSSPGVGSCSPGTSYGSRNPFLNPSRNNSSSKLVLDG